MDLMENSDLDLQQTMCDLSNLIENVVPKVKKWQAQHPNVSVEEVDSKAASLTYRWLTLMDTFWDLCLESERFLDEYEDTEDKGGNDNDDDESEDATDDA